MRLGWSAEMLEKEPGAGTGNRSTPDADLPPSNGPSTNVPLSDWGHPSAVASR